MRRRQAVFLRLSREDRVIQFSNLGTRGIVRETPGLPRLGA